MEPGFENEFTQLTSEADIDWILCIELNSNPNFRRWFGSEVFLVDSTKHLKAWRSISEQGLGESDLIWQVEDESGKKLIALIENKIDAVAQPAQYDRYVLRGDNYQKENRCHSFKVVLVSPEGYNSIDAAKYHRVTYQEIRNWFEKCATERSQFIASLFNAALERRFNPPIQWVIDFRNDVWKLANSKFPDIKLSKPAPHREYWVIERYQGFKICYKMYRNVQQGFHDCVLDLELAGRAADVEQLQMTYGSELIKLGATVVRAGGSAAFRIPVESVDPQERFNEAAVSMALQSWSKLLKWWQATDTNQAFLNKPTTVGDARLERFSG